MDHLVYTMEDEMKGLIEGLKIYNPAPSKPLNLIYKKYFQTFKPYIHNISNMPDIRFVYKRFDIKDINGLAVFLIDQEDPAPSKPLNLIYKKYFQTFKPYIHNISNMPDIRFVYKRFDIKDINGLAVFLIDQEDPAPFCQISTIGK